MCQTCSNEVTTYFGFPVRIYCSRIGSNEDDILLLEEPQENVYVNIRHTKDFQFVTVNTFSATYSKVLPYMHVYSFTFCSISFFICDQFLGLSNKCS